MWFEVLTCRFMLIISLDISHAIPFLQTRWVEEADEVNWYPGKVESFNPTRKQPFKVFYRDGDEEEGLFASNFSRWLYWDETEEAVLARQVQWLGVQPAWTPGSSTPTWEREKRGPGRPRKLSNAAANQQAAPSNQQALGKRPAKHPGRTAHDVGSNHKAVTGSIAGVKRQQSGGHGRSRTVRKGVGTHMDTFSSTSEDKSSSSSSEGSSTSGVSNSEADDDDDEDSDVARQANKRLRSLPVVGTGKLTRARSSGGQPTRQQAVAPTPQVSVNKGQLTQGLTTLLATAKPAAGTATAAESERKPPQPQQPIQQQPIQQQPTQQQPKQQQPAQQTQSLKKDHTDLATAVTKLRQQQQQVKAGRKKVMPVAYAEPFQQGGGQRPAQQQQKAAKQTVPGSVGASSSHQPAGTSGLKAANRVLQPAGQSAAAPKAAVSSKAAVPGSSTKLLPEPLRSATPPGAAAAAAPAVKNASGIATNATAKPSTQQLGNTQRTGGVNAVAPAGVAVISKGAAAGAEQQPTAATANTPAGVVPASAAHATTATTDATASMASATAATVPSANAHADSVLANLSAAEHAVGVKVDAVKLQPGSIARMQGSASVKEELSAAAKQEGSPVVKQEPSPAVKQGNTSILLNAASSLTKSLTKQHSSSSADSLAQLLASSAMGPGQSMTAAGRGGSSKAAVTKIGGPGSTASRLAASAKRAAASNELQDLMVNMVGTKGSIKAVAAKAVEACRDLGAAHVMRMIVERMGT